MNRTLRISAPSRLHFGLLRFEQSSGPSYGGLGMMISRPRTIVEVQQHTHWSATGRHHQRALEFAKTVHGQICGGQFPPAKVRVVTAADAHSGLGSGTQLALAVGQAILRLYKTDCDMATLVEVLGRGKRSAVGCYGFQRGGLIWEAGRYPGERIARLKQRLEVPASWRVVLVRPLNEWGVYGVSEANAFRNLPSVDPQVTRQLKQLAEESILPATSSNDFATFSQAVFEYSRLAGECFRPVQGGPYSSPTIARWIHRLRELGIEGVGQSSWGPTIFAYAENEFSAEQIVAELREIRDLPPAEFALTTLDNRGAQCEHPCMQPSGSG